MTHTEGKPSFMFSGRLFMSLYTAIEPLCRCTDRMILKETTQASPRSPDERRPIEAVGGTKSRLPVPSRQRFSNERDAVLGHCVPYFMP